MTKKEALSKQITLWWWNHGQKKKDFEGTYQEWFDKNEIKIRTTSTTIIMKGQYGSMDFRLDINKHADYLNEFNMAIKLCLTYMGDKAMMHDGFGREYKINWR